MDLLRFSTAGSVDDGKSTLIGRLLFDAKGVFEDQLEAVARSTVNRSAGPIDLSLLTDGLRAEREQGITIDVAYRYFATPRRKFIIADTPGHEQYTRNMATGSSTASLSIVLIDARYGALVQSRRHTFIAALLGIPHIVVAVNKMDLVGFSQARFDEIRADFEPFLRDLHVTSAQFIPLSALLGDNVVSGSENMAWYTGPTLLDHLETVDTGASENLSALRFPVQYVVRPNLDFRGFAGQVVAGGLAVGDAVKCLPAGTVSKVKRIHTLTGDLAVAFAPQSVTVLLEDEIDVSRGDMLVHPGHEPWIRREFDAHVVWMDATALDPARPYLIKHTSRTVRARVAKLHHRIDVNTLQHVPADGLQLNEIGKIRLACAQPLYLDPYPAFRRTGCFVVIDPLTNATVGAGMVAPAQPDDADLLAELGRVDRHARAVQHGHKASCLLVTCAAPTVQQAVVRQLEARLFQRAVAAVVADEGLVQGMPGAAPPVEKWAWLVKTWLQVGHVVVADAAALPRIDREQLRRAVGVDDAVEIHVDVAGAVGDPPAMPDVRVELDESGADGAVRRIVLALADRGLFGAPLVVSPGSGI